MSLPIIFEDNHLIAVNKPAGVLVHADATEDRTLEDYVKHYIKVRYKKPGDVFLGTIHRIDRPVSGVVVFARTSKALTRMNKLFQERQIEKTYWAITRERPPALSGKLEHYIYKDRDKNTSKAFDDFSSRAKANKAKKSELTYKVVAGANNRTVLEIKPKTGRPHQIRVQLQKIGCPIVGDLRYGYPSPLHDASIALHSRSLSFVHPVKKEPIIITAKPPNIQEWRQFKEPLNF
ncbi:MAG: RNA pseudouridine synthase [Saprospiraceae bacterium]